jgi:hypothetical protein
MILLSSYSQQVRTWDCDTNKGDLSQGASGKQARAQLSTNSSDLADHAT